VGFPVKNRAASTRNSEFPYPDHMAAQKCMFTRPDGTKCAAWAITGSRFCFFHDPASAEKRRKATEKGGQNARHKAQTPEHGGIILPDLLMGVPESSMVRITGTQDLKDLLERTLTLAFAGAVNAQLINSITSALREARQLLETEVLEKRIEELERRYGVHL
jgi:hypothetical protein